MIVCALTIQCLPFNQPLSSDIKVCLSCLCVSNRKKHNKPPTGSHNIDKFINSKNKPEKRLTKLCFRAPTTVSSLASNDIIGLARVERADSIWKQQKHKISEEYRKPLEETIIEICQRKQINTSPGTKQMNIKIIIVKNSCNRK